MDLTFDLDVRILDVVDSVLKVDGVVLVDAGVGLDACARRQHIVVETYLR